MDFVEQSMYVGVFCLAIFAVVHVLRLIAEYFIPKLLEDGTKLNSFYKKVLLPVVPVIFGGVTGGLVSSYPYPELFKSTISHVFFGLFCGLVSGLVYRVVKANLLKKISSADENLESNDS